MEIHFVKTVEDKSAGIEEQTHMKINAGSAYGEAPGERVEISEDYGELEFVAPSTGTSHRLFEEWLLNEGVDCQESIKRILCAHRQLFVDQLPARLPPERVINHTIMLLPGKMPGVLYRLNKDELEAQREIIQNLKSAKWITMTSSPFAAPAMVELNAITISPEYPLPRIQNILDLLHGAKVFSTMDMEQGFQQIRMAPEDQHKTAFRTCMGQYEFKVMPFGLKGAPGTFQAILCKQQTMTYRRVNVIQRR
ncbi:OSJNBa0074B10.7 protein, related [Eimeria brunetti]|uniref:OSJNBa0074B10.7 protein, related n=1 Tax=Eimeria brunetti TaxID=51314 RepID=U6LMW9_9EIME|nr:OSJNBa0074B10.7 protein, related [Eimeria brunetti]